MSNNPATSNSQPTQMMNFDQIWASLMPGIESIYEHRDVMAPNRYMELYTLVFNYCTNSQIEMPHQPIGKPGGRRGAKVNQPLAGNVQGADFVGEELYNRLHDWIENYANALLTSCQELAGEQLLDHYTQLWTNFQFSSTVVNGIFSYLNRHWIKRNIDEAVRHGILEVYQLAISVWKSVIFDALHHNITTAALALVEKERNGERIMTKLISGVVASYIELGINEEDPADGPAIPHQPLATQQRRPSNKYQVYRTHFERRFLDETKNFYTTESNMFLQGHANNVPDYMKKVEERLDEEQARCQLYLDSSTLDPLLSTCDEALITQHLELFHDKFEVLLSRQQNDHLGRMFNLCSRVQGALDRLKQILEEYIEREGKAAIQQIAREAFNDCKQYINCILKMYELYNKLVVESFKLDHGFVESMDKAFGKFINKNEVTDLAKNASKSPQLLVMYCDQLLRKSARNMEDEKMDENLEQVMTVFKYIEDKDVFQAFYHKLLCKRLVYDTSASEEAERCMIAKLKHMCGFEYTSKLERLLTDVALSRDNSEAFRQKHKPAGVDFSVIVVMSNVWPLAQPMQFELPRPLMECIDSFRQYYTNRFNGRKLNYALQMCRGELASLPGTFGQKYSFICNTQQITLLMQYNERDEFQLSELQAAIGVDFARDQLLAVLQSLTKTDLLRVKDAEGEAQSDLDPARVTDTWRFRLNTGFQNKKLKVDLIRAMSTAKEVKKESEEVQKTVEDDRKMVIQACIVRIMKMRKQLKHQQLVGEVLNQLTARFQPKVPIIKKCIDSLIEKEYLKRSDEDRDQYEYLA